MQSTAMVIEHEAPSNVSRLVSKPVKQSDEWKDRQFNDIRELCKFLADEIRFCGMNYSKIGRLANCHPSTVAHLARNETASPRCATVLQVLRALGFEVLVRG